MDTITSSCEGGAGPTSGLTDNGIKNDQSEQHQAQPRKPINALYSRA